MKPHEKVLARFAELTGTAFKFLPHYVERQACKFTEHFTLEDLEKVVSFIRWKLSCRASGFTTASYSWRKLFGDHGAGDEWQNFQERLGQANEALARRVWRPRFAVQQAAEETEPVGFREWLKVAYVTAPAETLAMRWKDVPELVKREFREAIR